MQSSPAGGVSPSCAFQPWIPDRPDRVERRTHRRPGPAKIVVTVSVDGDEQANDEIRGIGRLPPEIETFKALRRIPGIETVFRMTLSSS
jgi:hypothetical protein